MFVIEINYEGKKLALVLITQFVMSLALFQVAREGHSLVKVDINKSPTLVKKTFQRHLYRFTMMEENLSLVLEMKTWITAMILYSKG